MSNLKIISNNIGREATLTASSEVGALVVGNLQIDGKINIWRSLGVIESITAIFPSAVVSGVALIICNFSSTATIRVRAYTLSGDASPASDTGNVFCCEYTTIDKIDFAAGALNANTFNYGGGAYASLFFDAAACEKIIIDIIDNDNSAGYLDVSSLVIGEAWSPVRNADYGASLLFTDTSKSTRSGSGDLKVDRGAVYRSLSFSLSKMIATDRNKILEIFRVNGTSRNIFISLLPESDDASEQQMYQIFGNQTKLRGVTRFNYVFDKAALTIQEI